MRLSNSPMRCRAVKQHGPAGMPVASRVPATDSAGESVARQRRRALAGPFRHVSTAPANTVSCGGRQKWVGSRHSICPWSVRPTNFPSRTCTSPRTATRLGLPCSGQPSNAL